MFELHVHDRVAEVTLCRPPVNAISEEWGDAFVALLDELDARDDWSVLHLRSSQKVFAAGADLAQIQSWIAAAQPDARLSGLHRPAAGRLPKARSAVARDAGRDRRRGARRRPGARAAPATCASRPTT